MEIDILDSLEALGYSGLLRQEPELNEAIELGPKSVLFTELASWLSKKLKELYNLEEFINPVTDPEDASCFLLELSSFLKELNCPYDCLMEGAISQRLIQKKNRVLLLDFLCSELQAACIIEYRKRSQKKKSALDIELGASNTAKCLQFLLDTFGIEPEKTDDSLELFVKIHSKMDEVVSKHSHVLQAPAVENELSPSQWELLENIQGDMHKQYKIRRKMLLTRLDVTIQSFKWGEHSQGKEDKIAKIYMPLRAELKPDPDVNISHLIAARKDISILEKTSSAELVKNTKSLVNKVVIGTVPDRGGRANEQKPPVEMPNWQKRSQSGGGGMGRGGRQFRGRERGRRH